MDGYHFIFLIWAVCSAVVSAAPVVLGRTQLDDSFDLHSTSRSLLQAPNFQSSAAGSVVGLDIVVHDDHYEEHYDEPHIHDDSETSAEHLIESFGGTGHLYESELDTIIQDLNSRCTEEHSSHGHGHGHSHSSGKKRQVTTRMLTDTYGSDGLLSAENLTNACPDILRCQLEESCELVADATLGENDDKRLLMLKLLSAAVFFIEAIVGALVPVAMGCFDKMKRWMEILNCFSGGVFIATAALHMIPHIIDEQKSVTGIDDYPLGALMVVIGFVLVLFMEHVVFDVKSTTQLTRLESSNPDRAGARNYRQQSLSSEDIEPPVERKSPVGDLWRSHSNALTILMAISVHALLEALALGLEDSRSGVLLLFASIGSHKGVASMALSGRFVQNGATKKQIILFMASFAIVGPVGILLGSSTSDIGALPIVVLNGLAAGTFLYVGAYEILCEEFQCSESLQRAGSAARRIKTAKFLAVFVGVTVIASLQLISHD